MEAQLESNRRIKRAVELREHEDRFVDIRQAAEILHLSEASIRRFLTIKKLKRYKSAGSRTLIERKQVLSLIREA
jgi:hypothetical protein